MYCGPYSAGVLHSFSDQIKNLQNCFTPPQTKMTSKDDIKGLVSLSSFVHALLIPSVAEKGVHLCTNSAGQARFVAQGAQLLPPRHSHVAAAKKERNTVIEI